MRNINYLILFLFFLSSCSSVAGLRDKSYTIGNQGFKANIIEPIKDDSAVSGLSESLEAGLSEAFRVQLPRVKIVSADDFRSRIADNDLINEYVQWETTYNETKILSLRPLNKWSQIVKTRHFLMVTKVHLSREKIKGADMGYSGWVNDADNVWRTDLKILHRSLIQKPVLRLGKV
jgi:hypothetical protein